jgi:hypothetical protein
VRRLCVCASAGVKRVDDPVAPIDLCQEAHVAAAVAGMIPLLSTAVKKYQCEPCRS